MPTYLAVIDDSAAARVALRFAALRAANSLGSLEVLAIVEPQEFMQWGGVQAAMEAEERSRIEGEVAACLSELPGGTSFCLGRIVIHKGEPLDILRTHLAERTDIIALVVGAAASGPPGALVTAFTGTEAGKLPCPLTVVPGSLTENQLQALS
jgi:nucleotide-binding universal stress UspA family protein